MTEIEKYHIPKHLDMPFKILFWTTDEALFLFVPFLLGIQIDCVILGLISGIIFLLGWKRIKGKADNYVQYLLYWHFPSFLFRFKATPPSYKRFFIG